jgi:hypothetical protein
MVTDSETAKRASTWKKLGAFVRRIIAVPKAVAKEMSGTEEQSMIVRERDGDGDLI